jgi:hypothetical protein
LLETVEVRQLPAAVGRDPIEALALAAATV